MLKYIKMYMDIQNLKKTLTVTTHSHQNKTAQTKTLMCPKDPTQILPKMKLATKPLLMQEHRSSLNRHLDLIPVRHQSWY